VSHALAALRAGVSALLRAEGRDDLAALVEGAVVELAGKPQIWSMGSRDVRAHRVALLLGARAYRDLKADPAGAEAIHAAFSDAMRTSDTELSDLSLVLKLPGAEVGWNRAYRDAAVRTEPERPSAEAVRDGAVALLEAAGDEEASDVVARSTIESAEVMHTSDEPLIRYVLRLEPIEFLRVDGDAALAERIRKAVRDVGTRAIERVASVDFAAAEGASATRRGR